MLRHAKEDWLQRMFHCSTKEAIPARTPYHLPSDHLQISHRRPDGYLDGCPGPLVHSPAVASNQLSCFPSTTDGPTAPHVSHSGNQESFYYDNIMYKYQVRYPVLLQA